MSYQMWEWRCSACDEVFKSATAKGAEAKFLEHAQTHKPKVLVSINADDGGVFPVGVDKQ